MLRNILTFTLLLSSTFLFSQQFYTTKTPFFKSKKSTVTVINNLGADVIEMPLFYKKNKSEKGKLKVFSIADNRYEIKKHRGSEMVYSDDILIATITHKKKCSIHMLKDNNLYHQKKKGWFSKTTEFYNAELKESVAVKPKGRFYELEYTHEDKDPDTLLLALCLHLHIENQNKQQAIDDAIALSNSTISQN